MNDRKINVGDNDEVAAIDQRIAEINTELEKLLQKKQDILNKARSQQPQARLTTEKKISVFKSLFKGKHPLILTERREHAELLNQLLLEKKIHTVILRGAMRVKERNAANEQLPNAQAVVATGKYIGEGFDLPRLDTLFLAMPIAWKGSLAQYAGRIYRESTGKDKVTIFDYVDASLPMLQRMFNKRNKGYKGYKAMGYQITLSSTDKIVNSESQLEKTSVKAAVTFE